MYLPFLRGRQYELIALRELAEKKLLSDFVLPVVEPVKLSSTLTGTIMQFKKSRKELALIENPSVGSFLKEAAGEEGKLKYRNYVSEKDSPYLVNAVFVNKDTQGFLERWREEGVDDDKIITVCMKRDDSVYYKEPFMSSARYNIIPYNPAFRKIRGNRVLIDDKFTRQARNVDYALDEDEFFSEDHLYYKEDGYHGFSDYSIVGDEFVESGFAPYAVAIHIVYFSQDGSLRIRHFVSDSNDDITDPANKFYQAVGKLVQWNRTVGLDTYGIKSLEELHATGGYPGLGVVKKLSIMHHLELMGRYLSEVGQ